MDERSVPKQVLTDVYDTWYQQGDPHWERAPGKAVLINALQRCCPAGVTLRLLDVGCGTGSFPARIHVEVSPRWELHGVDFSEAAITQARRRHPDFHFSCADATALAFPDGSFDVVTCYGSWEHFEEPARAIAEAGRVLAPGGWVLAMIPALGIHRTDRDDEGWYEDTEVEGADARQMQWNLKRPTWEQMFEQAGLQLVADALAQRCGAHKPGVFFFGVRLAQDRPAASEAESAPAAFLELSRLAARLAHALAPSIDAAGRLVWESLCSGGKVLVCGNGGSAADAQHFVAELVGRMRHERRALPALALSSDPSVITALGNDYGYEHVFARQIEALGEADDVLLAISTSGQSPNILKALEVARQRGLRTIALLGEGGDPSLQACDVCLHVPSADTQRVQEIHTAVLHGICVYVERQVVAPSVGEGDA